jgi:hypothetical protein
MSKTNYRTVYKSDHLGVIDLDEILERGDKLIFTIREVKQEFGTKVAGNKIDANICYFEEPIKPLVLNSTNAKTLKNLSNSSFIENWKGMIIELYIDSNVKMKGEVVGGVRIKQLLHTKQLPFFTEANFEKAKTANATIELIKSRYQITAEVEQQYLNYVNGN